MLGVTNDQNYNDIADALREVGADLSEETFTPSEMAPAIRGLRSRWGNIEGDIANQTDLQNALNSKADSADLGTMSEEDDAPSDDKQYGRKNGDWVPITDELANWGQIAGNIADQTDLKNALDAKADSVDLGTMSEEDDAPSDDKQYGRKNGDWVPITDELANWGQIAGNLSDQTDLKNVLDEKLEAHDTELSGSIVTFEAENDHAIKGVTVSIEPVQDLHGYDNPWPAGGGKNILPITIAELKTLNSSGTWTGDTKYTRNDLQYTFETQDGYVTKIIINGTASTTTTFLFQGDTTHNEYNGKILNGCPSGGSGSTYNVTGYNFTDGVGFSVYDVGSGMTIPSNLTDKRYRLYIAVMSGYVANNVIFQLMIRDSAQSATFAPYSNVCPISGHTSATVTRTGKNLLALSADDMGINWNGDANAKRSWKSFKLPKGKYTFSGDGSAIGTYFTSTVVGRAKIPWPYTQEQWDNGQYFQHSQIYQNGTYTPKTYEVTDEYPYLDIGFISQSDNYETARLISDQNLLMQGQNNANQINVIQGFNQIASKIDALSAQMASCCCEIKTQMLQDRLTDAQAKIVSQQAEISNNAQSQYILGQMGKWVANAPAAAA